jgi:Domain of unknown function (DUF1707)
MPADPPSSPALRASDADRDRVTELLRAAVADGRLDPAEFDQRLDAALTARTIDALAPLTADLITAPGNDGSLAPPLAGTPAAELLTIHERHGSVRRDGRWTLPHRLALGTAWCDVMLDLTSAVRSGPELVIELRVRGGHIELVLAPGMVVDANELAVRVYHPGDQQGRRRQYAGDAARPPGRPDEARPDRHPVAGATRMTWGGLRTGRKACGWSRGSARSRPSRAGTRRCRRGRCPAARRRPGCTSSGR